MKTVFVSGCYDILHAGHLQFFREARALGDRLIVCFASAEVLMAHKQRRSSLPDEHKRALLLELETVDDVVIGTGTRIGFDFEEHFRRICPDILAVTEDSGHLEEKQTLCDEIGAKLIVMEKTPPQFTPISTTEIVRRTTSPVRVPLRVDFAGGWLDVPRHAIEGEFVVNCTITPMVSLFDWPYEQRSGLGGSGAWALLNGHNGVEAEIDLGVGWQDPAVIRETGCCVWRSGARPVLDCKRNGDFLYGRIGLQWTGGDHDTPGVADLERDYRAIARSGRLAREGVLHGSVAQLSEGVRLYYDTQICEGMQPLAEEPTALAWKYCGGGHGGYAAYLFESTKTRDAWVAADKSRRAVEPYTRS